MRYQGMTIMALTTAGFVQAMPKYETNDKVLAPSKRDYVHENGDQIAMESETGFNVTDAQDRPPRFGFPAYSQDVQTVNNVTPGLYGPVKLDIGGLVLGTIVGLGAFFILPKLFHVVSAPYGVYRRSEDEANSTQIGDILNTIQNGLNIYNTDPVSCLQRAVCFSVQSTEEKASNKTANRLAVVVGDVAKSDVVKSVIDGTEWSKAVNVAEKGENCTLAFPKCPVEVESIISAIARYLTS